MITLIAAVSRNGVIGKGNALPWHLPEDLKHFRQLTTGHAVIMGRKTWESLPDRFRPLPGRTNIVVTRNPDYVAAGALVVSSLEEAQRSGPASPGATLFVIGGAELYAYALPLAGRLELTEIETDVDGDVRFPDFDHNEWREVARVPGISTAGLRFSFASYARILLKS